MASIKSPTKPTDKKGKINNKGKVDVFFFFFFIFYL